MDNQQVYKLPYKLSILNCP